MTFWQFLDKQLGRIEDNGFGCFMFALFFVLPIIMAIIAVIGGAFVVR